MEDKKPEKQKKKGFIGELTATAAVAWLLLEALKAVVYFFTFQFLKDRFKKKGSDKDAEIFKKP